MWLGLAMKKLSRLSIATFLLTPIVIIAGSYAIYFGYIKGYTLSESTEKWGQFGDYFGGTLNPIYALLAFVGVLVTIYLQTEQLKVAEKRALIEEIQRLIFSVSTEIDSLLKQQPKITPAEFAGRNHPFTIFSLISATATSYLKNDPNAEIVKQKTIPCIELEVSSIIIELHQLTMTLEKYKTIGGDEIVVDFYKKRYEVIVCWFDVLGLVSSQSVIEFFNPKDFVVNLKPKTRSQSS